MGLKIDGIATSQHLDSSGETLHIDGHDISDLVEGKAVFNWEHSNKGPEDILGQIIAAKKILKASDCSTDREKMYWKACEKPFVYIVGELYDDEEHPGAVAAAAMMRYYHKRKEKLLTGFSIEGATLQRDGNELERSVGRRVAITLRPCNKTCIAGIIDDPKIADVVTKSMGNRINGLVEVDSIIFEDVADLYADLDPVSALKKSLSVLEKTLEAGNYNVAPSQLVGGAALQVEDRGLHNRVKAVFRDWDRRRPLKEAMKAALPEVSPDYLDHFVELAEQLSLKKGISTKMTRIGVEHSPHKFNDEDQKRLVEGLYSSKSQPFNESLSHMRKVQNDAGEPVILKRLVNESLGESPKNATVYHDVAKNFFGMGAHVPTTTYVQHPDLFGGAPTQAMKHMAEHQSPLGSYETYKNAMEQGRNDGSAHKLAVMDMVTGHGDRHAGNMLVDPHNRLINIDNDSAFQHTGTPALNAYEPMLGDSLHVDAGKWLSQLDARQLGQMLIMHDMDPKAIRQSVTKLKMLQQMGAQGATFGQMHDAMDRVK